MSFLPIFTKMVELFIIILIGYISGKLGVLGRETKSQLTKIILYVAIPCTVLASVMNSTSIPSGPQMARLLGVAFSSYIVLFILAKLAGLILPVKGARKGAVEFGIMFCNVGFIGYPVTQAIFGKECLLYTTMFNLPFNILCYSIGAAMIRSQAMAAAGNTGANAQEKAECLPNRVSRGKDSTDANTQEKSAILGLSLAELKKLLLTPAMISSVLALIMALLHLQGPAVLGETLDIVGSMTTPGALLVIGITLSELPVKEMFSNVQAYLFTIVAVIITPLVMYFLYRPFTTGDPLLFGETVIITAMPVATAGTMLSVTYHGDEKFMAQITFLSTLASVVTIPLMAMLL